MKIIVGLGNPGTRYRATPHNMGFEVADELSRRLTATFRFWNQERAEVAEARIGDEPLLLAKPATWMNLSGISARELMRNRPVQFDGLLVVSDDVNLEIGRLRVRGQGSAGGHNGLRSVIECLGTENFARLRIGVRPQTAIEDLAEYVLRKSPPKDAERFREMIPLAADAALCWAESGAEAAANKFNGAAPFAGEENR